MKRPGNKMNSPLYEKERRVLYSPKPHMYDTYLEKKEEERIRAEKSRVVTKRNQPASFRDCIETFGERTFGDPRYASVVEPNPRYATIVELKELFDWGAFPRHTLYTEKYVDVVLSHDPQSYDIPKAADYYHHKRTTIATLSKTLDTMVTGFLEGLEIIYNHYDEHGDLRDYIAREFVDQIHRITRGDVETGVQYNTIEDYVLVDTEHSSSDVTGFLNKCYKRIEEIESGARKYDSVNGEQYIEPSSYPLLSQQKQDAFMYKYEGQINNEMYDFFATYGNDTWGDDIGATYLDFKLKCLLDMRGIVATIETEIGTEFRLVEHKDNKELSRPIWHIKEVVASRKMIRKQGQMLAALSHCLIKVWNLHPESQPLSCYTLWFRSASWWFTNAYRLHVGPFPDKEPLLQDEDFMNEVFPNNDDPVAMMSNVVEVWKFARDSVAKFEAVHAAEPGSHTLYNYKLKKWQTGQMTNKSFALHGEEIRDVTIDYLYKDIGEYVAGAAEDVAAIVLTYQKKWRVNQQALASQNSRKY